MNSKGFIAAGLVTCALIIGVDAKGFPPGQESAVPSDSANLNDQGTFSISLAGHMVGTEKFNIRFSLGKIEAAAETEMKIEQDRGNIDLRSAPRLVMTSQFEPQTYSIDQKGSQTFHLEVDFRTSPAKSRLHLATNKSDDVRDAILPKDVLILDDNVIHHYQILISRFAMKSDKKQTFNAYIPQEAVPGVLNVEEIGTEQLEIAGRKETLRHLVVSTELARIDLWADAQQRLQRVYNPALQLEAIRIK